MDWESFFRLLLGGIVKGSIYSLMALGYTMVYGIIELINFAHGEVYMLGAFIALIAATVLGLTGMPVAGTLLLALCVAILYCSATGYTVEKVAYRPLRGAPRLSPLISAIGMSTFLQNYVMLAQTSQTLPFPELPELPLPNAVLDYMDVSEVLIILVSALVMITLTLFIRYSRMGKAIRATAQNRKMAMLLGIDADKVISLTFIIGSALAAVGGVLVASHMGQAKYTIGFVAGMKSFTAAVLGGIGSIPGAMLGGIVLGLCESFGAGYISSDYEDAIAFAILVIILVLRPSGILGRPKVQKV